LALPKLYRGEFLSGIAPVVDTTFSLAARDLA
jgi:hypothetical protein